MRKTSMNKELKKYYDLELNNLTIIEKYHIGCKLLSDAVPDLKPIAPNVCDSLWEKIYKAEMILQTENNQKQIITLLGECLEILEDYRS